jgi:hypothetical protein
MSALTFEAKYLIGSIIVAGFLDGITQLTMPGLTPLVVVAHLCGIVYVFQRDAKPRWIEPDPILAALETEFD